MKIVFYDAQLNDIYQLPLNDYVNHILSVILVQTLIPFHLSSVKWKIERKQERKEKRMKEKEKNLIAGHHSLSVIPAHRRLRQEDHEFKFSLGYIVTPFLKTQTNKKKQWYLIVVQCLGKGLVNDVLTCDLCC
jgi:hypothetical protein